MLPKPRQSGGRLLMGKYNRGSVFQIANGSWVFKVSHTVNGIRRTSEVRRQDEAEVRQMLADYRATLPEQPPTLTRKQLEARARELGTHTKEEYREVHRNAPANCPPCGVRLDIFNSTEDHIIPPIRGGSDAIDNLQIICWQCNQDKGDQLDWVYSGPPREYAPHPLRVRALKAGLQRKRQLSRQGSPS